MFALFRAIVERIKALFVTDAALDFEAELLSREAERKAGLLRQAAGYEAEGLHELAEQLRRRAEAHDLDRPLASVLPALEHWQVSIAAPSPQADTASAAVLGLDRPPQTMAPAARKRGRPKR